MVEFREVKNFYSPRTESGVCTKYFADLKGTTSGWEIGKMAYLSRTKQSTDLA